MSHPPIVAPPGKQGTSMADSVTNPHIWNEIERSESYLVCCMFEEAASLAASILKELRVDKSTYADKDFQSHDMMESAGIVLVQSWRELGRSSKILDGLKELFDAVTDIPVSVVLASVCFQIAEGSTSGAQEFLEAFLSKWRLVDEQYYVLIGQAETSYLEGCGGHTFLDIDKYLQAVEVYVITLLATALKDIDLAVSWVEKALIPEDKRQKLLRRLDSLCSRNATVSRNGYIPPLLPGEQRDYSSSSSKRSPRSLKGQYLSDGDKNTTAVSKLSRRFDPYFWWFRTINLKFGKTRLVISNGKFVLGCMIFIICYIFQRNLANFKRMARNQAMSVKKALLDLWQLAFSYQANPLATVHPPPVSRIGSR